MWALHRGIKDNNLSICNTGHVFKNLDFLVPSTRSVVGIDDTHSISLNFFEKWCDSVVKKYSRKFFFILILYCQLMNNENVMKTIWPNSFMWILVGMWDVNFNPMHLHPRGSTFSGYWPGHGGWKVELNVMPHVVHKVEHIGDCQRITTLNRIIRVWYTKYQ